MIAASRVHWYTSGLVDDDVFVWDFVEDFDGYGCYWRFMAVNDISGMKYLGISIGKHIRKHLDQLEQIAVLYDSARLCYYTI
jgi:hypothetical protein